MAMKKLYILKKLSLLLLIFSCSSNKDYDQLSKIFQLYNNQFEEKPIKTFTKKEFEPFNYEIVEIKTNGVLKQGLMLPITRRYGYTNYITGSGQSFNTQGKLISKTNGVNINLLSVEITPNPFLDKTNINNWPTKTIRTYSYLTPLNNTKTITFHCSIKEKSYEEILILDTKLDVDKMIEKCSSRKYVFENTYWLDKKGFIWKSRQWISPENIFAELTVLKKDPNI